MSHREQSSGSWESAVAENHWTDASVWSVKALLKELISTRDNPIIKTVNPQD